MLVRIVGGHGGVAPGYRATSYLIDGELLIDAGSVASGLLIDEQILIENIIISHPHMDHICELAYLSDNCFGLKEKPFEIYCNNPVRNAIQTHFMNDVIWPDFSKLPSKKSPTIRFHDLDPEKKMKIGGYEVLPVLVNHPGEALGFIIEKKKNKKKSSSILFTQDTGPTDRIWELAKNYDNLKAIFTEVSFPNEMQKVATSSMHHTPNSLNAEIEKMPPDLPIFLGHLKPNYQTQLFSEIEDLDNDRLTVLGSSDTSYVF